MGLLGLLALNTVMAQNAFAVKDLTTKQAAFTDQEQALQQQVAVLQSPQELAQRAAALGMVEGQNPVFLDPRTGKVLGVPVAAPTPAPPAPVASKPATTPSAAASTGTAAAKPATTKPADHQARDNQAGAPQSPRRPSPRRPSPLRRTR